MDSVVKLGHQNKGGDPVLQVCYSPHAYHLPVYVWKNHPLI